MRHGFIDLHTHGIKQYDTRTDKPEDILKMAEFHGRAGTGAILPTIYSGPIDEMKKNMEAVRKAIEIQQTADSRQQSPPHPPLGKGGRRGGDHSSLIAHHSSLILGVHLEGPFLNPLRCGALDKNSFIKPTISSLERLIDGYEDIVKIITIAPEMPGALKIIEKCIKLGIKVNMGHSDATYKQAVEGKRAGATGITHIFNAMRPFHHREPGIAGFGLLDEGVYIEVIADGVHIHPKALEFVFSTKRFDRIMLVSDSVKSNLPIPPLVKAMARRGGKGGFLGKKGIPIYTKEGILAGSSITISDSLKILKDIGISEAEIIKTAVDNPERYLSLEF